MEMKRTGKIQHLDPQLARHTEIAAAGFTSRHEGVSRPPYNSLNLGTTTLDSPHNVEGNRSILARTFGIDLEHLVTVDQVHGTDLLLIDTPNPDYSHFLKLECDGIITNQPGIMIGICVADCVPLLLLDPVQRVVAAIHAGWKGTAGNIGKNGIAAMVEMFDSNPADILAAVGPAIGPCCYEVDTPVREAFRKNNLPWEFFATERRKDAWGLDLAAANRSQLLDAGIAEHHIEMAAQCTSCSQELFFSYRRDKGETGRQMGFIMLAAS